jgi:NarL family two-component system response regulator LiaR
MVAARVLVVDDNAEMRALVNFLLGQDPDLVLIGEAEDGGSAVVFARQHRPDLVVMDLLMPRVGGLDATHQIKSEWPETKVLVLTSLDDDETKRFAFANGADFFLNKRDIATRLVPAIRATIGSSVARH